MTTDAKNVPSYNSIGTDDVFIRVWKINDRVSQFITKFLHIHEKKI